MWSDMLMSLKQTGPMPIFAWAGSEALPWLFIGSSPGPFIISCVHLQAIGGGAEYIDEAVPGMKAHSLVLWNSVSQKRFNLVKP